MLETAIETFLILMDCILNKKSKEINQNQKPKKQNGESVPSLRGTHKRAH